MSAKDESDTWNTATMMLKMTTVKRVKPMKDFCQPSVLTLVKTSLTMKTMMITTYGIKVNLK